MSQIPQGIEINAGFKQALDALAHADDEYLFITGKAGTGKSTLLSYFREVANQTLVVLAPTGVAALNVGGETIHHFFGFGVDVTPDTVRAPRRGADIYQSLECIIIDEASMLRADLLDCVNVFLRKYGPHKKRPFGGVRMVFFGDLYQLPPVVTGAEREIFRSCYESPFFFSAAGLQDADLRIIELDKVYRQKDADFIELLNRIRNDSLLDGDMARLDELVDEEFEPSPDEFCVNLTVTNKRADQVNEYRLDTLPGKPLRQVAEIEGDFARESRPTAEHLMFKEGAQIMLLNNDSKGRWVNGSLGVIESVRALKKEGILSVRLSDSDELVEVQRFRWEVVRFKLDAGRIVAEEVGSFTQFPFRLAWAVTIHKSQGKTFDRVVIDFERGAFAAGQAYVALSRCTSLQGMVLRRPIKPSSIRADWTVRKFLSSHAWREADKKMSVEDKTAAIEQAVKDGHLVSMKYLKPDDSHSERLVQPVTIGRESYAGKSFLAMRAFCQLRQAERVFRIDRILEMQVIDGEAKQ